VNWQRPPDDPGDIAQKQLASVPSVAAAYLQSHPGATALQHRDGQLRYRNPNGTKGAILGSVTRRDLQTGNWTPSQPVLSQTPNGWRLDGTPNEIKIRKKGSDQHTINQTFPDLDTKHESVLSIDFPALVYDKDLVFHYTSGGIPWTLRFDQTGAFDFFSVVSKRQGPKTYTLGVSSSEPLTVGPKGNLIGDSHVNLSRAVMIPRFGKSVPCSAWAYARDGGASFTCDDSVLKDNQLPYKIDPSTHDILAPGNFTVDSWAGTTYDCSGDSPCWGSGGSDVNVSVPTTGFMPASATLISASCRYDASDVNLLDGDDLSCSLPNGFRNDASTNVHVGIGANSCCSSNISYYDSATISNVGVTVVWNSPPVYSYSVSSQNPLLVGSGYQFYWNSTDPDGDQIQPEILISGTGGVHQRAEFPVTECRPLIPHGSPTIAATTRHTTTRLTTTIRPFPIRNARITKGTLVERATLIPAGMAPTCISPQLSPARNPST